MTQDIEHWAEYLDVLGDIMKSISTDEQREDCFPEANWRDAEGRERQR
ncbi:MULTISPECIES: hypothetical protein [Streptomyces]|nr:MULTISPECIES: hypothetical protein [Streptomyces]